MFPILGWTNNDGQPLVIGFAGKARSGKDTAGKYLVDTYQFVHYSFAKPLKEGAKAMFNLTDEQIDNKEKVVEPWGKSPRQIYQQLGTDVARSIDPNIWVKNAEMYINRQPGFSFVITDVRFSNEALWIRNRGGIVVYINRDQELIRDRSHASENGLSGEDVDVYIENNGTINSLYEKIEEMRAPV
tara:strand:+ start:1502 stop:2059 length:558 start_codon:yes stop_codon:yes gene_type:complete